MRAKRGPPGELLTARVQISPVEGHLVLAGLFLCLGRLLCKLGPFNGIFVVIGGLCRGGLCRFLFCSLALPANARIRISAGVCARAREPVRHRVHVHAQLLGERLFARLGLGLLPLVGLFVHKFLSKPGFC
jgi:hypothetical protein